MSSKTLFGYFVPTKLKYGMLYRQRTSRAKAQRSEFMDKETARKIFRLLFNTSLLYCSKKLIQKSYWINLIWKQCLKTGKVFRKLYRDFPILHEQGYLDNRWK